MIKVENIEIFGLEGAMRGMRNPLNSWDKADTTVYQEHDREFINIGVNDLNLASRLIKAGTEHRKFLRMIHVQMDVIAPLYWWKEADTYKIGTTANSCSTMHTLTKRPFAEKDFSFERLEGFPAKDYFDVEENFEEKFVDIPGHEFYAISNKGRVYSKRRNKFLTPCINSSDYKKVNLNDKNLYVHRLVATAFCPNPASLQEVNHIDGNKWNNNYTNLEWVSKSENALHAFTMGLRKIDGYTRYKVSHSNRLFGDKEIEDIHNKYNDGMSMQEIADRYKCYSSTISDILTGKTYKEIEMSQYDSARILLDALNELREQYLETKDKKYWYALIQLLPSSYNQRRTWDISMETLLSILHQRKNHKLDEWNEFRDICLEQVPYLKEFYEASLKENNNENSQN